MKKKLLTVLLAVVMVFGVFGLTACGGSNADADYNYYTSKYSIDIDEVAIEAVTFQGVYKMFTTAGNFVLYVDSEGAGAADRFAKVNKLANDWNITIYHFNPDLSGGYKATGNPSANIITDGIKGDALKTVQSTLSAISKVEATEWVDNSLIGIKGAESSVSGGAVSYKGSIAKLDSKNDSGFYTGDNMAKAIAAVAGVKKPSYGAYTDAKKDIPTVPEAYMTESINTMNLFGDARLHMYNDDNGVDALTDAKEDVFVTVANYGMFEDLLKNNKGYFAVFFGGTWCPNTQAIVYHVNKLAKDYGIEKVYFFDPRLEDGTKIDTVSNGAIVENGAYLASALNTRNNDAEAQWASLSDAAKAEKYLLAIEVADDSTAGFIATTKAKYDSDKIKKIKEDAILEAAEDLEASVLTGLKATYTKKAWTAKYGILDYADEAAYLADNYDADDYAFDATGYVVGTHEYAQAQQAALKAGEAALKAAKKAYKDGVAAAELALAKETLEFAEVDLAEIQDEAVIAAAEDEDLIDDGVIAAAKAAYVESVYNYAHLYGSFLGEYLSTYWSEWNITAELTIGGETYTRMCVPNMMLFNGEEEGSAKLVALAEAEYTWANTSEEGNPQKDAWENAVKAVFDQNPYASYAPVLVAEDSAAADTGSSSSSSSSSSSAAADSAC